MPPRYPSYREWSGRYNLAEVDCDLEEKVHCSVPSPPPLIRGEPLNEEFDRVYRDLAALVASHATLPVSTPRSDDDCLYAVGDDWHGDRTQSICCYGTAEVTTGLVRGVQQLLVDKWPLWRVIITAPLDDDVIIIYPHSVRNDDAYLDESLDTTVSRYNAHHRTWQRRCDRYRPKLASKAPHIPPFPSLAEAKVQYNESPKTTRPELALWNSVPSPPHAARSRVSKVPPRARGRLGRVRCGDYDE